MKKKIILLSVIAIAVALFFVFDLGQYQSLESLKSNRGQLRAFYESNAVVMIAAFIGMYIVTVALSLPGTFVYANAGSNLASINQLSDIASLEVLGAFALLGLFALIPTLYKYFKSMNNPPSSTDGVKQES